MAEMWKPKSREILQHWIDVIMDEGGKELSGWEISFIESMQAHLEGGGGLSQSQEKKLEQIYVARTS